MVSDPEQLRKVKALLELPGLGCARDCCTQAEGSLEDHGYSLKTEPSQMTGKGGQHKLNLCLVSARMVRQDYNTWANRTKINHLIKGLTTQDKGGPERNYKKKMGKIKIADIFFSVQYDVCNLGQYAQ